MRFTGTTLSMQLISWMKCKSEQKMRIKIRKLKISKYLRNVHAEITRFTESDHVDKMDRSFENERSKTWNDELTPKRNVR